MNVGQFNIMMGALREIRDRLPALAAAPAPARQPEPVEAGADGRRALELAWKNTAHCADSVRARAIETGLKNQGWELVRHGLRPQSERPSWTARYEAGARTALSEMLTVLDSWIEGAAENHEGEGHRGESIGEECWTRHHPQDIRRMINDVARSLGLEEFPKPAVPVETRVRA